MKSGILEIILVEAKGLRGADLLFDKIDPYVVLHYKGQERKSSVARGQGSNPRWNEKFTLRAEYPGNGSDYKLLLKLMDKDTFSKDDFLGQATIYVKDLLEMGAENGTADLHATKYSVVQADDSYCGEIKVKLSFKLMGGGHNFEEEIGGWKESNDY
ncbi:hypothetical protein V2J09_012569 [Rumex salicifolius]